jgi:hypothetical protein
MSSHPAPVPSEPSAPRERPLERQGLEEWFAAGEDDTAALCDPNAGAPLRWVEGVGWVNEPE